MQDLWRGYKWCILLGRKRTTRIELFRFFFFSLGVLFSFIEKGMFTWVFPLRLCLLCSFQENKKLHLLSHRYSFSSFFVLCWQQRLIFRMACSWFDSLEWYIVIGVRVGVFLFISCLPLINRQTITPHQLLACPLLPPFLLLVFLVRQRERQSLFSRSCALWVIAGLRGIHTLTGFPPMQPNQVTLFYLVNFSRKYKNDLCFFITSVNMSSPTLA